MSEHNFIYILEFILIILVSSIIVDIYEHILIGMLVFIVHNINKIKNVANKIIRYQKNNLMHI